ncbi:LysM domain-containing protein [Lactobacillus xujianguonis]|uniref:LysM domain-containing protein n=1 Tax=Lactobacillus xujianguonis TaxID=2495899 RepID=A0A437SSN5_9LACO|nr:LysM peptidoglycan-binding domain-containing protein [Lactobacillus xujianguonis]RVU69933.1 LysM domain-containing protein [Lactobacillus xujianguonis]
MVYVAKKQPTYVVKAQKTANKYKKLMNRDKKRAKNAKDSALGSYQNSVLHPKRKKYFLNLQKKYLKAEKAANKAYSRHKKEYNKAKKKVKTETYKANKSAVADKIAQHERGHHNEGNCAIYRSDGHSQTVIFISPSDTESESSDVEITSWPVDKGAPRSNYARTSSDTKTVAGLITGEDRAEANKKYAQLVTWKDNHVTLTYEGDFVEKDLLISNISNTFKNMSDNLQVSITFTHVRAANITVSTGNNAKTKKSKSTKTTRGRRNKKYTAITVKPGDTLLGISRKYGKSVSWLQKVNKIKNPNKIKAGRNLYVSEKQKKISKNMRVR